MLKQANLPSISSTENIYDLLPSNEEDSEAPYEVSLDNEPTFGSAYVSVRYKAIDGIAS